MYITPELAAKILERVRELIALSDKNTQRATRFALKSGALPLSFDMGGLFALKPDGEIICILWDEPKSPKVEFDPRIRNAVLFEGSKKYPELAELIPPKSVETRTCPYCEGTGIPTDPPNVPSEQIVCYRGGLGWIP